MNKGKAYRQRILSHIERVSNDAYNGDKRVQSPNVNLSYVDSEPSFNHIANKTDSVETINSPTYNKLYQTANSLLIDGEFFELLVNSKLFELVNNAFCPTGSGGGVDPSCPPHMRKTTETKTATKEEMEHALTETDKSRDSKLQQGASKDGKPVEGEIERPTASATDKGRHDDSKSSSDQPTKSIPTTIEEANKRIDKFANLFRSKGDHERADYLEQLKSHVNAVGTEESLRSLGDEVHAKGEHEKIQYGGVSDDISHFAKAYLEKYGITPIHMGNAPSEHGPRVVSSVAPTSTKGEGIEGRGEIGTKAQDVYPKLQGLRDKLHESQNLPGLEKSEDMGKLMGGKFGSRVENFTSDVVKKLDEHYGKGQWIVKSYGDEAYAGYGIFFPQRAEQLHQEAKSIIHSSSQELEKYGFKYIRGKVSGEIKGIEHESGDMYHFGTDHYENTIHGDVRRYADMVGEERIVKDHEGKEINVGSPAKSEKGAKIPTGSFMAQPAFPVVGINDAERAAGVTFKKGQEGRVHIRTVDGKAEIIPHSTWLKKEHLPVVFENDDTRAMAKAARDAIDKLPHSEKQGQLYAPDIVKTKDGYKVVEANPANEAGASGYLADNPFIIDAYVSHVTGREPTHVKFIRSLLTSKATHNYLVTNGLFSLATAMWHAISTITRNAKGIKKKVTNTFCPTGEGGGVDSSCTKLSGAIGKDEGKGISKSEVGESTVAKFGEPKGNWKTPTELPGENKGALPEVKPFKAPPLPKGKAGEGGAGGVSAVDGMTNTHIGDLVEHVLGKGGDFKSLLPDGQRQNPLDTKYDDSDQGFEIKGVSTHATEYKSAPKTEEVESKLGYAEQYGFTPNLIVAVIDPDSLEIHAYMRKGKVVGSLYKGGKLNDREFHYLGTHKFSEEDIEATRPPPKAEKKGKSKGKKVDNYNPEQLRDEHGKWSSSISGDDVGKVLEDQHEQVKAREHEREVGGSLANTKRYEADYLQDKFVKSKKFHLMDIPIDSVSPIAHVKPGAKTTTDAPIIVDENKGSFGRGMYGAPPRIVILDGKHRHNEAKEQGKKTIRAWVGEEAVKHLKGATMA